MNEKKRTRTSLSEYLTQRLKNDEFRAAFEAEREKIEIARLVQMARKKEHLSQRQLAELAGVKQSFIARLEGEKMSYLPRLDTLRHIFEALGYETNLTIKKMRKAA